MHVQPEMCQQLTKITRTPQKHPSSADLSQSSVSLPGQAGNPPSGDNTLRTLTLGDGNGVKHLIGLEY